MAGRTAAQELASVLGGLHLKAGKPTLQALVRAGQQQVPAVSLSTSSLGAWLKGESVPSNRAAVGFLFGHLTALARRKGEPVPDVSWTKLWEEACAEKRALRGGRPPRPRVVTAESLAATEGRGTLVSALQAADACSEWEVHPSAVAASGAGGALPLYMRRAHDAAVRQVVAQAGAGSSGMVVLVGSSSAGKTRACWEAVQELPAGWRLWHPLVPTPAKALADALEEGVAPRTAIWLNELQRYVGESADEEAERVAAGLRALLQDPERGPVLVLATVWPEHWTAMTDRPFMGADRYPQARELLAGRAVHVPSSFDQPVSDDIRAVGAHDPRLAEAMERAADGQITQYLAGAPALTDRYHTAPPGAAALVRAAMDLSRLGGVSRIPPGFLEAAADGYLSDSEYDALGEDWFEQALTYATTPFRGVRGMLSPVRTRPGVSDSTPRFLLADYLDQTGRKERRYAAPPASFWQAARRHLDEPQVLTSLARAAQARWRDQEATLLYQQVLDSGDTRSALSLAWLWQQRDRPEEAAQVRRQAALAGHVEALEEHLRELVDAADLTGAEEVLREAADKGVPAAQLILARALEEDDQLDEAARWYDDVARCGDTEVLRAYASDLRSRGDLDRTRRILQAAGDGKAVRELAFLAAESGSAEEAEKAAVEAFAYGETRPLHLLAQKAVAEGQSADGVRYYRHAVPVMERRRRLRSTQGGLIDLLAGPRPLTDFINPSELPMPSGETWALRELVALLDEVEGQQAGDKALRSAADGGNRWALEMLIRRLHERGAERDGEALLMERAAEGELWALWTLAHRARHDATADRAQAQALLKSAAAAGIAQAYAAMVEDSENAGLTEEADQWALRAAAGNYTQPLWNLIREREKTGSFDTAERLAWHAAASLGTSVVRQLAEKRNADVAVPLLWRAHEAGMPWAPGMLAMRLEAAGEHTRAESLARIAADTGDREPLEVLAGKRACDDPGGSWRALLANGLTAQGTTAPPW
ncbi:ATP-binding protein [Streptomyces sp. NPDC047315]|uniref:ATP-binding protein n=1 Tax=Streptomyces sp. NPDC047315 TaxID=3155142 RepID=UPI0033FB4D05